MTAKEIKTSYKMAHDELSELHYQKKHTVGVTPEEQAQFDLQHGKILADMREELIAEGYLVVLPPVKSLEERVAELEAKLKAK